jgi:hypothetical protein
MKKKLKKAHPVNTNLEKVDGALHDHALEFPGSKVLKKMLITAFPKAMGDGAAADERQPCQTVIVDAIGEILSAEVTKCTEKEAAATAELETATAEKATAAATLEAAQKALDDKKADIEAKKEQHHKDKTAVHDADVALKAAIKAVEHHDADVKKTEEKKAKFEAALTVTLAGLKKGEYENAKEKRAAEGKGVETLRGLLSDAGADDSLTTCFHAALAKKPDDRGSFDTTVIETVEKRLSGKIAELSSELAKGPAAKDEKEKASEAAKGAKESCTSAFESSGEALKTAEGEKPALDAALKTATHDDKEKTKAVTHITSGKLEPATAALASAKENYEAWKYLAETTVEARTPPEPEPPAEEAPAEEAPAEEAPAEE